MSVRDDAVTKAVREIYDGWLRAGRSLEEAFAFATVCRPTLGSLWDEAVEHTKENWVPPMGTRE